MDRSRRAAVVAALEVAVAATVVVLDVLIPSLVLTLLAAGSLAVRRTGPASLGLRRPEHPSRLVWAMVGFSLAWAVLHIALIDPVVNHATGQEQDTSDFTSLEGDLAQLVLLLVLSWTLAACAEEFAFRGYVMTRAAEVFGGGRAATVLAVAVSAVLFGLIHTEQGLVGVLLATIDGAVFGVLALAYRTLWAPVLAHGFANTIGLVAFFLVGPVDALW